jgi:hypothetical protein
MDEILLVVRAGNQLGFAWALVGFLAEILP